MDDNSLLWRTSDDNILKFRCGTVSLDHIVMLRYDATYFYRHSVVCLSVRLSVCLSVCLCVCLLDTTVVIESHDSIENLKTSLFANHSHRSLLFLLQDRLHIFPSCLYRYFWAYPFLIFLVFPFILFSIWFRAVDWADLRGAIKKFCNLAIKS